MERDATRPPVPFAGREKRLGKAHSPFDMEINADIKGIRSQQPYGDHPVPDDKSKMPRRPLKIGIIQPAMSEIESSVIMVQEKGNARFCVDLREVNSKTLAVRYALPHHLFDQDPVSEVITTFSTSKSSSN